MNNSDNTPPLGATHYSGDLEEEWWKNAWLKEMVLPHKIEYHILMVDDWGNPTGWWAYYDYLPSDFKKITEGDVWI